MHTRFASGLTSLLLVQETLEGRGATLKEQVIAVELYGKDISFSRARSVPRP